MMTQTVKRFVGIGVIGITAAVGLSGCVVSDDPAVNAIATTAAVGTVASLIYYSNDDGYYYDDYYNRMPRSYRPAYDARIRRIDSMSDYRRRYPLHAHSVYQQRERSRILQERVEQERHYNRALHDRIERERRQNQMLQNRLDRQREQNRLMQRRAEDWDNRNRLMRERMEQQRHTTQQPQRVYRTNESRLLNRKPNAQSPSVPVRAPRSDSLRAPWERYGS